MQYILASASPRRKELMRFIAPDFLTIPSLAPEIIPENSSPEDAPEILAVQKATNIAKEYPDDLIIGADTGVFINEKLLGKPRNTEQARAMLKILSGQTHKVITGCCICYKGKKHHFSEITDVTFYTLSDKEINDYISTNEPYDKAGGYGIQQHGGLFVKKISGDYFNVVGFPIAKLKREINLFLDQFN